MEFPIPYLSESVAPISILSPLSFSPLRQSYQIVLVVSRTAAGRLSHLSASRTPKSAFATMDDMVSTTICAAALQQPSSPAKISYSARRVYCGGAAFWFHTSIILTPARPSTSFARQSTRQSYWRSGPHLFPPAVCGGSLQ